MTRSSQLPNTSNQLLKGGVIVDSRGQQYLMLPDGQLHRLDHKGTPSAENENVKKRASQA